jgi:hypothetical protein
MTEASIYRTWICEKCKNTKLGINLRFFLILH